MDTQFCDLYQLYTELGMFLDMYLIGKVVLLRGIQ